MSKAKKLTEAQYFEDQKTMFSGVTRHAWLIGNRIGVRKADARRVMASWLFIRACVTAASLIKLFEPHKTEFGDITYVDHASIAALARSLMETVTVMIYVGDIDIPEEEWVCRQHVIDLHDFQNRTQFLDLISYKSKAKADPKDTRKFLVDRLTANSCFANLPEAKKKRILDGDEMFMNGRHNAMLKLGLGDKLTRGVYKYLSNHAHSQSMAFHRTETNAIYSKEGGASKVTAAFSIEFARKALGAGCIHAFALFPDTELAIDAAIVAGLKDTYNPAVD